MGPETINGIMVHDAHIEERHEIDVLTKGFSIFRDE